MLKASRLKNTVPVSLRLLLRTVPHGDQQSDSRNEKGFEAPKKEAADEEAPKARARSHAHFKNALAEHIEGEEVYSGHSRKVKTALVSLCNGEQCRE